MTQFLSATAEQTLELGQQIGKLIKQGMSIALKGDLGAGKTTFVQGLARGLKVSEQYYITSPTFSIINEYPSSDMTLCHLDLYRLGSVEELEYIGFNDLLDDVHLIVVEWPQLLEQDHFVFDLEIRFTLDEHYNRIIDILALKEKGKRLLTELS
ncbi:MAG: tRNA (adenosine(37)-N6)-threonylcarbamoyltransferase complex ATPase subunit type 1 TsaE [Pseudomonadota bacterium]